MYGFLTKLLVSRKLNFEEGEIDLLGEQVCFVPVNFLYLLTKYTKTKKDINDLYFEAWAGGYLITLKMMKDYKLKKFEERYKIAMDVVSLMGLGDYKTIEFRPGFAKFRVLKDPLPLKFHPNKELVCHFLRGANAGGGTVVHEMLINCVEIECAAQNGKYCTFINTTEDVIKKMDKKLVNSQLDLKYLKEKELNLIKTSGFKIKI